MLQMASNETDYDLHLILIGESCTCRTAHLRRFCPEAYFPQADAGTGATHGIRIIEIDGRKILLRIWDVSAYRSLADLHCKFAVGIVLVYDITRKETFEAIRSRWIPFVLENAREGTMMILVGNVCDLEKKREVSPENGEQLAKEYGMKFMETSSKDGTTYTETVFFTLAQDCVSKMEKKVKRGNKTWLSIKKTVRTAFGFSSSKEKASHRKHKDEKDERDRPG